MIYVYHSEWVFHHIQDFRFWFFWQWYRILVAILRTRWEWILLNMFTLWIFDDDQSIIWDDNGNESLFSQPVSNSENSINRASNTMSVTIKFDCVMLCVLKKNALQFSGARVTGWGCDWMIRVTIDKTYPNSFRYVTNEETYLEI